MHTEKPDNSEISLCRSSDAFTSAVVTWLLHSYINMQQVRNTFSPLPTTYFFQWTIRYLGVNVITESKKSDLTDNIFIFFPGGMQMHLCNVHANTMLTAIQITITYPKTPPSTYVLYIKCVRSLVCFYVFVGGVKESRSRETDDGKRRRWVHIIWN